MSKVHDIKKISFVGDTMKVLVDGKEHSFSLNEISKRLLMAAPHEREHFEISPSGYGIHWPLIDEDLSIDGLLGITHNPTSKHAKASA